MCSRIRTHGYAVLSQDRHARSERHDCEVDAFMAGDIRAKVVNERTAGHRLEREWCH